MQLETSTVYVPFFKMQEHAYIGYGNQVFEFVQLNELRLRLTCFSFYIMYKRKEVCKYLPVFQLSVTSAPENPKKFFLKNETFGHIEDFLQKFFNLFLEVNSFLRNCLQYFAKEVEQNFMKELSCEQKKKIH